MPKLRLAEQEPFAVGGTRLCYVHPCDPGKCVKVLRPDRTPQVRRRQAVGIRRLRPLRYFDDQWKERRAYLALPSSGRDAIWRHVPEYFGCVESDRGQAIVTRLFRNHDGSWPEMLESVARRGLPPPVLVAIDQFKSWLRETLFLSRHLLPHNILVVRETENRCRLVIVDGLGNSEAIPFSSWFKVMARRKIERKIRYFDHRLALLLPDGEPPAGEVAWQGATAATASEESP